MHAPLATATQYRPMLFTWQSFAQMAGRGNPKMPRKGQHRHHDHYAPAEDAHGWLPLLSNRPPLPGLVFLQPLSNWAR